MAGLSYESTCYCTNLRRSANALSEFYDAALKKAGVTVSQYNLLVNLSRLGSANITRWAERVGLERSTMVRNIAVLEARGMVETAPGRGRVLTLSPAGREALERAVPIWEEAQRKLEDFLGEDAAAILRIGARLQRLPPRAT